MAAEAADAGGAAAAATDDESGGRVLQQPDLPLLVFHGYKEDDMHMLSVSADHQIRLHKNVEHCSLVLRRRENLYWSTTQGWMLIMEYPQDGSSTAAYLWNPCTGDKLPLPNIPEHHDMVLGSRCLLTHKDPAAHPGCVVALLLKNGAQPHMWFCHTKDGRWRCSPYEVPIRRFISVITPCRGKLYFINSSESMGVIHFPSSANGGDHPVFQYFDVSTTAVSLLDGTTATSWLVESHDGNQLFLIRRCSVPSNLTVAVQAYKMDFSAHAWRRVHDIGDQAIFLDGGGHKRMATSCAASPLGLKASQIYMIDYRNSGDGASYYLRNFDLGLDILEDIGVPHSSSVLLSGSGPFWIVPPS
ncbi:unnamed protein product [Urochloa humidicola]